MAGMFPWSWSLVVRKDEIVVLGPGLGFGAQAFVKNPWLTVIVFFTEDC